MQIINVIYFITGCALGLIAYFFLQRKKIGSFEMMGQSIIQSAEKEALTLKQKAEMQVKELHLDHQRQVDQSWQIEKKKMERELQRIEKQEEKLEERMELFDKKLSDIGRKEAEIQKKFATLEEEKASYAQKKERIVKELERIASFTAQEAKEMLINSLTEDVKKEAALLIRRKRQEAEEEVERHAATIIATAIQRLAVPCVSESTVNTISIPTDEMKGRIIGREGRNIRALEKATGVNFFVDDTPGLVVISTYDPVRLHIAKESLTDLINDGRIHPTRIEEAVQKARSDVEKKLRLFGEDAALRAGLVSIHPELLKLLGRLKFRTSYGQNVLEHSLEVSHLMAIMATELGLDSQLAARIGLMHDIGKAVSHEVPGTHAMIGYDFALKYGESQEVANGIGCHHNEINPTTIEGSLCSAADAISASRPGARIEAVEEYIKRLKNLETIAHDFNGVEKAYALQAGRELRVMVVPDIIDDNATVTLARDITNRIETELRFPGKIKVTVIREKQAVEWAL